MRQTFRRLFDAAVGLMPPALLRGFFKTFNAHPEYAERAGFQIYRRVFYNPFPDPAEVDREKLRKKRELPGIDIDVPAAVALVEKLTAYSAELSQFPRDPNTGSVTWSMTYRSHDTAALYTMIRHLKPKRYIEVGCGWSSRASSAAIVRNRAEGHKCDALYIEPYPPPHLADVQLAGELLVKKVQEVPVERFAQLESGDLLFLDTSHIIKAQNDVEYEFIHVLPAMKAGVYVHVHDIWTPYDYPAELLVENHPNRGANNEQYALECLLSGGGAWEVVLPLNLLWREQRPALERLYAGSNDEPLAFYIRKTR